MGQAALAFLAGMGGGYMSQQQRNIENKRAADADQRAQDFHDIQMRNAQRDADLQASLAQAARPAQVDVGAGGVTKPDTADNIDVGQPGEPGSDNGPALSQGTLVNGTAYNNSGDAATAAASYNDPNAVTLRQVQAYQQAGKPVDAMNLQKNALTLNKEQTEFARTLKDEGAFDAAKALRAGDAQGMVDAFNRGGQYKIVGTPVLTPRERDLPGFGKVMTYDAQYDIQNPDGSITHRQQNSHDLSMQLMPYEKALDLQRKGQSESDRAEYQSQLIDVKGKVADAQAQAAQAKAEATAARSAQGPSREERLRWTSLFQDAGRQMIETQKTINQLQRDPLFMRNARKDPNGPEAKQLSDLQATYADHKQSRDTFRGLLAGAATGPTLGNAPNAKPSTSPLPMPQNKSDLKAGTVYQTSRGPATWNGTAFEQ